MIAHTIYGQEEETVWFLEEVLITVVWMCYIGVSMKVVKVSKWWWYFMW